MDALEDLVYGINIEMPVTYECKDALRKAVDVLQRTKIGLTV